MRYGIFADVHANLEAFETVLSCFKEESIDQFVFLGDIVGYGADPKPCIKLLQEINAVCIVGNHDRAVCNKFSLNFFNAWAKEALLWTQKQLDENELNFLQNLKLKKVIKETTFVHGTLHKPEKFLYMTNVSNVMQSLKILNSRICFVGHSHRPINFICNKNYEIAYNYDTDIIIDDSKQYIVNVGSVGQPRDLNPNACFCIYDTSKNIVTIKRVPYDIIKAQEKIIKSGLPEFLAVRIGVGR